MRISLTLLCILGCGLGWVRTTASAQAPATSSQFCAPAMLDVSVLPFPPTFTYGGHIFVLEIHNISPAACSRQLPQVVLEPPSDTNNQPFYSAWRPAILGIKPNLNLGYLSRGRGLTFSLPGPLAPDQS